MFDKFPNSQVDSAHESISQSKEHYTKAFEGSVVRASKRYPELPYHHPGHMKDVMEAVGELVELLPSDSYPRVTTPWQKDLLALAAAWHDAGFDDDEAQEYPTKEEYAIALMKEDIKSNDIGLTDHEIAFLDRAIRGTIMVPALQQRDTPEAKLLHHADMAYMTADWETFWRGAEAFHHEEHPDMLWENFQKFEAKFFPIYMESLKNDFQLLGIAEDEIKKRLDTLKSHRKRIMEMSNPWLKRQNNQ
ncbi:MAG: hypothetical protein Q4B27_00120 [Candidatus Saccharibacteria bacterium]|nr:hypothetical protein [Candidatus Saccharibacteria bacterium]